MGPGGPWWGWSGKKGDPFSRRNREPDAFCPFGTHMSHLCNCSVLTDNYVMRTPVVSLNVSYLRQLICKAVCYVKHCAYWQIKSVRLNG